MLFLRSNVVVKRTNVVYKHGTVNLLPMDLELLGMSELGRYPVTVVVLKEGEVFDVSDFVRRFRDFEREEEAKRELGLVRKARVMVRLREDEK